MNDDTCIVCCDHPCDCTCHSSPAADTATIGEDLLIELDATLCCVAQLLDGWHNDGTAWSEWDESVRKDVSRVHRKVYNIHQRMLLLRGPQLCHARVAAPKMSSTRGPLPDATRPCNNRQPCPDHPTPSNLS